MAADKRHPLRSSRVIKPMAPVDLGWVAGVIEGEGYLGSPNERPRLVVSMTDEDVIRRLHEVTGVGSVVCLDKVAKAHYKVQWRWHVSAETEVQSLLEALLPHFGKRRKEAAELALGICSRKQAMRREH